MKTIKLTKKLRTAIETERAQAIGMLDFAEIQVRKTEGESGKDSPEHKKALKHQKTLNDAIDDCNARLGLSVKAFSKEMEKVAEMPG